MFVPDGELLHEFRREINVTSLTTDTSGEQLVEREALREAIVRSVGRGRPSITQCTRLDTLSNQHVVSPFNLSNQHVQLCL